VRAVAPDRRRHGGGVTVNLVERVAVELVLDTALDPVLDDAEKQPDPEQALLAVTACDPAIGSGHFMVAAARRIANRLATVRSGEIDPTPIDAQQAMHDVVARCIYGVDLNPMAADLAKVSLWLETMTPGRPLSFLDHHIKVGKRSARHHTGTAARRDPDAAYAALTGDDKKIATALKKLNAAQRSGQGVLARTAPVGPEVDEHDARVLHGRGEGVVGQLGGSHAGCKEHRPPRVPEAPGLPPALVGRPAHTAGRDGRARHLDRDPGSCEAPHVTRESTWQNA
jgi:hypothetical protein